MPSPYDNAFIIDYGDGDVSVERYRTPQIIDENTIVHTVLPGETIQHIAFKYYGDSGYWADIASANEIYNPFEEIEPGTQLYIP